MRKILLHACCAPCACYVVEKLAPLYDVSLFYYNPNISPPAEYEKRRDELFRFASIKNIPVVEQKPDRTAWACVVKEYILFGERSERCWRCYRMRLDAAFKAACTGGFDLVGTVLTISPHKDARRINEAGSALSASYGIDFLAEDFKKHDGFKKSLQLSAEYGFYRQDYCGCIFSKLERDKTSPWYEKVRVFKESRALDTI